MRRNRLVLINLACIAGLTLLGAAAGQVYISMSAEACAHAALVRIMEEDGAPGVMAAVVREGELVWSGAVGQADLEAGVPLTPHTRMRIGSVSKTLTAALVLRLAEQGAIDLDADVRSLVPELAEPQRGVITPRRLAAHTSGVRHYDFSNYLDANNVYVYPTLSDALGNYASDPLQFEPGTDFLYSSIGYNILGIAAERASGLDYAGLLAREITGPLALNDTMIDHPLEIVANRTRFYTRFPDTVTRNTIWRDSSDFYPSGGLLSSAEDLARFTARVFSGGWLSPASMALVTTEAVTSDGTGVGYTFGWQIIRDDAGEVLYFEHGGETNGAYAFVRYFPSSQTAVAGIANVNFAAGEPIFFDVIGEEIPAAFRQ